VIYKFPDIPHNHEFGKGEEMQTVFSHIVQKRFSQEYEDVATDALAFVLDSRESARNGMMKLLRGIVPDMPALRFRTQQTEDGKRPDMRGYDEGKPRVFVENKFWAGLTDNQPVEYLKQLAEYTQPTILLVVAPETRVQMLWHELIRRLKDAGISAINRDTAAGIVHSVTTEKGPILALTSWTNLLSALKLEVADDQLARSDLFQLEALCKAADSDAFVPMSSEQVFDQRTPAFILQLSSIVQASVKLADTEGVLKIGRLQPQASWERIGHYAWVSDEQGVGIWFGIHFGLWKTRGGTPLWLVFSPTSFGRALEVRSLLEQWADKERVLNVYENDELAVAVDIAFGKDRDQVVRGVADRLKEIADVLSPLKQKPMGPA
jgi:hypothetical protein